MGGRLPALALDSPGHRRGRPQGRYAAGRGGIVAELVTIDENLERRHLSDAERADLSGRRKELYEALHPETRHEAFKGNQHTSGSRKVCDNQPDRFTATTAKLTGRSERAVQLDVERARAIGGDLKRVVGTSLDKGVELDALAKLPEPERRALIDRAEKGEKVSARPLAVAAKPARVRPATTTAEVRVLRQIGEVKADRFCKQLHPEVRHGAIGNGRQKSWQIANSTPAGFIARLPSVWQVARLATCQIAPPRPRPT